MNRAKKFVPWNQLTGKPSQVSGLKSSITKGKPKWHRRGKRWLPCVLCCVLCCDTLGKELFGWCQENTFCCFNKSSKAVMKLLFKWKLVVILCKTEWFVSPSSCQKDDPAVVKDQQYIPKLALPHFNFRACCSSKISPDLQHTAVNHLLPTKHIQEVKDAALVMAEIFKHSLSVNMLCLVLENENIKRSRMR